MTAINILFGTESGNAELVADDIAETFNNAGIDAEVVAMEDYDVTELPGAGTVVVITSTYGEGELPATTQPFEDAPADAKARPLTTSVRRVSDSATVATRPTTTPSASSPRTSPAWARSRSARPAATTPSVVTRSPASPPRGLRRSST